MGLELTRVDTKWRGLLVGVIAVGYLALLALRTEFLVIVNGEPAAMALLQASCSIAISAGMVLFGAAVLARIRPRLIVQGDRRQR